MSFDAPRDQIVWDVGHQAYPHKMLTGRKGRFETLRQEGGLSGFLKRDESEYDAFGAGHAATAISAALGMAAARDLMDDEFPDVVAVVGDGALTSGLSYEGLNNAGASGRDTHRRPQRQRDVHRAQRRRDLAQYLDIIQRNPIYNRVRSALGTLVDELPGPLSALAASCASGRKA